MVDPQRSIFFVSHHKVRLFLTEHPHLLSLINKNGV